MYGYTAFVQPIRDTYRNYDDVRRMRVIMSILGFAILFIAALNYVLISISSLSHRAKSVGVHKCSGASGGTVFSMFLLETGIIIVAALLLMALIMINFRDFVEDTVVVKLSTLLAPQRIWVPLSVVLLLFIVGGVLAGPALCAYSRVAGVPPLYRGEKVGDVRCCLCSLQAWHSSVD